MARLVAHLSAVERKLLPAKLGNVLEWDDGNKGYYNGLDSITGTNDKLTDKCVDIIPLGQRGDPGKRQKDEQPIKPYLGLEQSTTRNEVLTAARYNRLDTVPKSWYFMTTFAHTFAIQLSKEIHNSRSLASDPDWGLRRTQSVVSVQRLLRRRGGAYNCR